MFQDITMAVMLRAVFGVEDAAELARLDELFREFLRIAAIPIVLLIPPLQINLGPRSPWGRFLALRAEIDSMIYGLIASRRARGDARERQDVLSLLLCATHEDGSLLKDQELRDDLVTVLAGGFDTSANSLAWTLGLLLSGSEQPLQRLRTEIDSTLGETPVDSGSLPRLPYLEAVLKESLRLHPAVPILLRRLLEPTEIGGFALPAGTIAAPLIYIAHRREAVYPEPDRFRPERFLQGEPEPYAFIPFGRGVRRCIGMAFAMHEMKVVLATLLQRMELRLAKDAPLRSKRFGPIIIPADGVPVIFTPRARGGQHAEVGRN
jgi:cytochrome P450